MSKPSKKKVYGLLAEYDSAAAVFHACEQVRAGGPRVASEGVA